jgi:hypothetical protein
MKKPYLVTLVSANEEPPMFVTARSPKAAVDQVALLLTPKAEMFPRFKVVCLVPGHRTDHWKVRVLGYRARIDRSLGCTWRQSRP